MKYQYKTNKKNTNKYTRAFFEFISGGYQIMKKCKTIKLDAGIINKVVHSRVLAEDEKLAFLKYVGYMTLSERKELELLV